jgi:hypothetical protein
VHRYREQVAGMPGEGRSDPAIADLLVRFADTLASKLTTERDR